MTGDLFEDERRRPAPSHTRDRNDGDKPRPAPEINRWHQNAVAPRYFSVKGKSLSLDDLYRMTDFHSVVERMPDDEIIVVLDAAREKPIVYLMALPKGHPNRLDSRGRQDPAKAPFWRHGDVMFINPISRAPP